LDPVEEEVKLFEEDNNKNLIKDKEEKKLA